MLLGLLLFRRDSPFFTRAAYTFGFLLTCWLLPSCLSDIFASSSMADVLLDIERVYMFELSRGQVGEVTVVQS